jgi:hypothetical protein
MNGIVNAMDAWRSIRDSKEFIGSIFGAVATVFCFIMSGAGW